MEAEREEAIFTDGDDLERRYADLQEKYRKFEKEHRQLERLHRRLESDCRRVGIMYKSAEHLRDFNEAEKDLQYFYNRLLLQTCADIIFVLDRDMRVVLATDTLAKFLGYSDVEEIVNHQLESLFFHRMPSEWIGETTGNCRRVFETSLPLNFTRRLLLLDGEEFTADCTFSPAVDKNGTLHGVVFVMHDVTELDRAKERAEEASRAKGNFLATMSHEIRTPLNAIIGLSEVELRNELPDGTRENLEKIYNSGSTLLGIVNDILDISKIESKNFEILPAGYEIASLVNDAVQLNIVRVGSKNIVFKLFLDETIPAVLYGDELRIKQILNNLLSNAFKYTDAGRVTFRVGWERRENAAWLTFVVSDTGYGIREEDMGRLFARYSQLDTRANRRIEGTGLGLSITKNLVDLMEGTISVESEYGKGSVFTVALPQKILDETPLGTEMAEYLKDFRLMEKHRSRGGNFVRAYMPGGRVLVVDDVATNLDVMRGLLLPYGLKIDFASSGREAIAMFREAKTKYDVVFMDYMMPEMDGIEATRVIREEIGTEYARTVPVIALTANALTGNREMFLANGFNAFISKPIDLMQLDTVLNRWIRDRQSPADGEENPAGMDLSAASHPPEGECSMEMDVGKEHIEGVDLVAGLEIYGTAASWLGILRSFVTHTPELLSKMRRAANDDLNDYAMAVHGLKGASYGICAAMIGEEAEFLERAAREGDSRTIVVRGEAFIVSVERLLSELEELLAAAEGEKRERATTPDPALLDELLEADRHFRSLAMDEILTKLERYEYESGGELVEWLRARFEELDYGAIQEKLEEVLPGRQA